MWLFRKITSHQNPEDFRETKNPISKNRRVKKTKIKSRKLENFSDTAWIHRFFKAFDFLEFRSTYRNPRDLKSDGIFRSRFSERKLCLHHYYKAKIKISLTLTFSLAFFTNSKPQKPEKIAPIWTMVNSFSSIGARIVKFFHLNFAQCSIGVENPIGRRFLNGFRVCFLRFSDFLILLSG